MEYEAPVLNTKYGVCTIDIKQDGRIINADRGFSEMTGYTIDELNNNKIKYAYLMIQEERSDIFNYLKNKTIQNGMACMEHFLRCKDNSVMTVSCFARSLGGGYIDVMLTQNLGHIDDNSGSGYDSLTGFYNYNSAYAEISRILMRGHEENNSVLLYKVKNVRQLEEIYGKSFAGTIIENTAIYIYNQYRAKGRRVVMARIRRDTFMVFHCAAEQELVKGIAEWSCSEMNKYYYGRNKHVSSGVVAGICHMEPKISFDDTLLKAEQALAYAEEQGIDCETYDEAKSYPDVSPVYINVADEEEKDRILTYDNRFISFAVSMLANAKSPDSSMDILIQRVGWRFTLNHVMVNVFEQAHYARVTNHYAIGKGVLLGENIVEDMDNWDGFFQSFDSNGCMKIKDTSDPSVPERDRQYYQRYNIKAVVNYLLYDNDRLIGYVMFGMPETKEKWTQNNLNTLMQISKIIALFISMRLNNERNEQRYTELSIDSLTGLCIYPTFLKSAKKAMYRYNPKKTYACIYADIDNFSYINENFGYEAGNEILKNFALRIQRVRTDEGICCHVHADKFVVLSVRDSREQIEETIKRLNAEFCDMSRELYPMSDMRIVTGIYYIEDPNEDIVRAVDHAIHVWKFAKKDKYKEFEIYSEQFALERQQRLNIIGSVHSAIENGEIEAFMQPKFSMKTMQVVGAEALARWRNPDGSYKFPNQFIPHLEDVGYIVDVDFCVYEQVLQAITRWKRDGKKIVPVSVNFSRHHIEHEDFVCKIKELTEKYDVEPKYIEIEITESAFARKPEKMMRFMDELREDGYKIDIDDFGTGYSSLNMLLDVPVDIVKIDKSFIDDYTTQTKRDYINQIGNLIQTANKDIIFEGVETEEQMRFLTSCGYENAQGYVFSKPIPMKEFEEKYIY